MGNKINRYILLESLLMNPPFFLFEDIDLSLFKSIDALASVLLKRLNNSISISKLQLPSKS